MKSTRKSVLAGALAGAVIAGGAVGATAFGAGSSTSSTKSNVPVFSNAARSGTFHPIEAKAHEANESAAREAQEDAGQFPTVP